MARSAVHSTEADLSASAPWSSGLQTLTLAYEGWSEQRAGADNRQGSREAMSLCCKNRSALKRSRT